MPAVQQTNLERDAPPGEARAGDPPELQALFRAARHRQNLCVLTVLTWLASCDGSIAPDELELLRGVAAGVAGGEEVLPDVIDVARRARAEDLELACRYLRNHMDRADKVLLARLLVTLAAQDGQLTVAENHVLRFLADVLGVPARRFAKLFEEVTGRPFPEPGDPSDPQWWRRREAGEEATPSAEATAGGPEAGFAAAAAGDDVGPMTQPAALRLLGLEDGASTEAVRGAYRRLAKARHPDRFVRLGPAAQATAAEAFRRVQEAYALLSAETAGMKTATSDKGSGVTDKG